MFTLHPQIAKDSHIVGQFRLCLVLLHKDANFPWVMLVPKRESVREIYHLSEEDQVQLVRESSHLAEVMTSLFAPTKMNIAALGNMVPQLHIHHVARYDTDIAWPKAIWGMAEAKDYDSDLLQKTLRRLHSSLVGEGFEVYDGSVSDRAASAGFTP